jgi:hypothetical protein
LGSKQLWDSWLWIDEGYFETWDDSTTFDAIKNDVENLGNQVEKIYKHMKIFDFV